MGQEPNLGDTSLLHWSLKNKEDDEQPCVLWVPYFETKPQTFPLLGHVPYDAAVCCK